MERCNAADLDEFRDAAAPFRISLDHGDGAGLRNAYFAGVDWERAADLDARAAPLTAAILLARVDGKSPADYLQTDGDRGFVRDTARRLLGGAPSTLAGLAAEWNEALSTR